jgi:hypothetical protein
MAVPFRWTLSWIVSAYTTNRLVVWLGYGSRFTLFAKQSSGSSITLTVREYSMEGKISETQVVVDNNTHTLIYDKENPPGTHLVISSDSNVATPGIYFYGYGRN